MGAPREGWVSVAQAASALSAAGDAIDASNVSRYLARFAEIPQEKHGKYRFVDLARLVEHRGTNVLVGEKRASRDIEPPAHAVRAAEAEEFQPSGINTANLRLKQLQIEERELDMAERAGKLVPDSEVLAVVNGVVLAMLAELERQETSIAVRFGREVAAEVRKARKAAQARASAKLIEEARRYLPAHLTRQAQGAEDAEAA